MLQIVELIFLFYSFVSILYILCYINILALFLRAMSFHAQSALLFVSILHNIYIYI